MHGPRFVHSSMIKAKQEKDPNVSTEFEAQICLE